MQTNRENDFYSSELSHMNFLTQLIRPVELTVGAREMSSSASRSGEAQQNIKRALLDLFIQQLRNQIILCAHGVDIFNLELGEAHIRQLRRDFYANASRDSVQGGSEKTCINEDGCGKACVRDVTDAWVSHSRVARLLFERIRDIAQILILGRELPAAECKLKRCNVNIRPLSSCFKYGKSYSGNSSRESSDSISNASLLTVERKVCLLGELGTLANRLPTIFRVYYNIINLAFSEIEAIANESYQIVHALGSDAGLALDTEGLLKSGCGASHSLQEQKLCSAVPATIRRLLDGTPELEFSEKVLQSLLTSQVINDFINRYLINYQNRGVLPHALTRALCAVVFDAINSPSMVVRMQGIRCAKALMYDINFARRFRRAEGFDLVCINSVDTEGNTKQIYKNGPLPEGQRMPNQGIFLHGDVKGSRVKNVRRSALAYSFCLREMYDALDLFHYCVRLQISTMLFVPQSKFCGIYGGALLGGRPVASDSIPFQRTQSNPSKGAGTATRKQSRLGQEKFASNVNSLPRNTVFGSLGSGYFDVLGEVLYDASMPLSVLISTQNEESGGNSIASFWEVLCADYFARLSYYTIQADCVFILFHPKSVSSNLSANAPPVSSSSLDNHVPPKCVSDIDGQVLPWSVVHCIGSLIELNDYPRGPYRFSVYAETRQRLAHEVRDLNFAEALCLKDPTREDVGDTGHNENITVKRDGHREARIKGVLENAAKMCQSASTEPTIVTPHELRVKVINIFLDLLLINPELLASAGGVRRLIMAALMPSITKETLSTHVIMNILMCFEDPLRRVTLSDADLSLILTFSPDSWQLHLTAVNEALKKTVEDVLEPGPLQPSHSWDASEDGSVPCSSRMSSVCSPEKGTASRIIEVNGTFYINSIFDATPSSEVCFTSVEDNISRARNDKERTENCTLQSVDPKEWIYIFNNLLVYHVSFFDLIVRMRRVLAEVLTTWSGLLWVASESKGLRALIDRLTLPSFAPKPSPGTPPYEDPGCIDDRLAILSVFELVLRKMAPHSRINMCRIFPRPPPPFNCVGNRLVSVLRHRSLSSHVDSPRPPSEVLWERVRSRFSNALLLLNTAGSDDDDESSDDGDFEGPLDGSLLARLTQSLRGNKRSKSPRDVDLRGTGLHLFSRPRGVNFLDSANDVFYPGFARDVYGQYLHDGLFCSEREEAHELREAITGEAEHLELVAPPLVAFGNYNIMDPFMGMLLSVLITHGLPMALIELVKKGAITAAERRVRTRTQESPNAYSTDPDTAERSWDDGEQEYLDEARYRNEVIVAEASRFLQQLIRLINRVLPREAGNAVSSALNHAIVSVNLLLTSSNSHMVITGPAALREGSGSPFELEPSLRAIGGDDVVRANMSLGTTRGPGDRPDIRYSLFGPFTACARLARHGRRMIFTAKNFMHYESALRFPFASSVGTSPNITEAAGTSTFPPAFHSFSIEDEVFFRLLVKMNIEKDICSYDLSGAWGPMRGMTQKPDVPCKRTRLITKSELCANVHLLWDLDALSMFIQRGLFSDKNRVKYLMLHTNIIESLLAFFTPPVCAPPKRLKHILSTERTEVSNTTHKPHSSGHYTTRAALLSARIRSYYSPIEYHPVHSPDTKEGFSESPPDAHSVFEPAVFGYMLKNSKRVQVFVWVLPALVDQLLLAGEVGARALEDSGFVVALRNMLLEASSWDQLGENVLQRPFFSVDYYVMLERNKAKGYLPSASPTVSKSVAQKSLNTSALCDIEVLRMLVRDDSSGQQMRVSRACLMTSNPEDYSRKKDGDEIIASCTRGSHLEKEVLSWNCKKKKNDIDLQPALGCEQLRSTVIGTYFSVISRFTMNHEGLRILKQYGILEVIRAFFSFTIMGKMQLNQSSSNSMQNSSNGTEKSGEKPFPFHSHLIATSHKKSAADGVNSYSNTVKGSVNYKNKAEVGGDFFSAKNATEKQKILALNKKNAQYEAGSCERERRRENPMSRRNDFKRKYINTDLSSGVIASNDDNKEVSLLISRILARARPGKTSKGVLVYLCLSLLRSLFFGCVTHYGVCEELRDVLVMSITGCLAHSEDALAAHGVSYTSSPTEDNKASALFPTERREGIAEGALPQQQDALFSTAAVTNKLKMIGLVQMSSVVWRDLSFRVPFAINVLLSVITEYWGKLSAGGAPQFFPVGFRQWNNDDACDSSFIADGSVLVEKSLHRVATRALARSVIINNGYVKIIETCFDLLCSICFLSSDAMEFLISRDPVILLQADILKSSTEGCSGFCRDGGADLNNNAFSLFSELQLGHKGGFFASGMINYPGAVYTYVPKISLQRLLYRMLAHPAGYRFLLTHTPTGQLIKQPPRTMHCVEGAERPTEKSWLDCEIAYWETYGAVRYVDEISNALFLRNSLGLTSQPSEQMCTRGRSSVSPKRGEDAVMNAAPAQVVLEDALALSLRFRFGGRGSRTPPAEHSAMFPATVTDHSGRFDGSLYGLPHGSGHIASLESAYLADSINEAPLPPPSRLPFGFTENSSYAFPDHLLEFLCQHKEGVDYVVYHTKLFSSAVQVLLLSQRNNLHEHAAFHLRPHYGSDCAGGVTLKESLSSQERESRYGARWESYDEGHDSSAIDQEIQPLDCCVDAENALNPTRTYHSRSVSSEYLLYDEKKQIYDSANGDSGANQLEEAVGAVRAAQMKHRVRCNKCTRYGSRYCNVNQHYTEPKSCVYGTSRTLSESRKASLKDWRIPMSPSLPRYGGYASLSAALFGVALDETSADGCSALTLANTVRVVQASLFIVAHVGGNSDSGFENVQRAQVLVLPQKPSEEDVSGSSGLGGILQRTRDANFVELNNRKRQIFDDFCRCKDVEGVCTFFLCKCTADNEYNSYAGRHEDEESAHGINVPLNLVQENITEPSATEFARFLGISLESSSYIWSYSHGTLLKSVMQIQRYNEMPSLRCTAITALSILCRNERAREYFQHEKCSVRFEENGYVSGGYNVFNRVFQHYRVAELFHAISSTRSIQAIIPFEMGPRSASHASSRHPHKNAVYTGRENQPLGMMRQTQNGFLSALPGQLMRASELGSSTVRFSVCFVADSRHDWMKLRRWPYAFIPPRLAARSAVQLFVNSTNRPSCGFHGVSGVALESGCGFEFVSDPPDYLVELLLSLTNPLTCEQAKIRLASMLRGCYEYAAYTSTLIERTRHVSHTIDYKDGSGVKWGENATIHALEEDADTEDIRAAARLRHPFNILRKKTTVKFILKMFSSYSLRHKERKFLAELYSRLRELRYMLPVMSNLEQRVPPIEG